MKPTMQVVVLQQQYHILVGSPVVTSLPDFSEGLGWDSDGLYDNDILR